MQACDGIRTRCYAFIITFTIRLSVQRVNRKKGDEESITIVRRYFWTGGRQRNKRRRFLSLPSLTVEDQVPPLRQHEWTHFIKFAHEILGNENTSPFLHHSQDIYVTKQKGGKENTLPDIVICSCHTSYVKSKPKLPSFRDISAKGSAQRKPSLFFIPLEEQT